MHTIIHHSSLVPIPIIEIPSPLAILHASSPARTEGEEEEEEKKKEADRSEPINPPPQPHQYDENISQEPVY
ncbi:hypothetical protein BO70DRAFT_360569 [Aspergillus heteromorphus CBS 117.55]|uniref:Uncharacterized protein n=1 Tax=Aspergillus heteromorphus CBS 117.55 TaxID=1448321 RepID=A0A317WKN5_9EURO|nr:uncharacterized protein BO70DRAFT_360569 [Aspergillus heteromorphus CBS 117.55]PWY86859.1 hypothetical protein BO70DRAFT_360569 [Aspergillus heteromorphus CBS 117.55]